MPELSRFRGLHSCLGGFQKSVTYGEQRFPAARSYSLVKPPRTGRRLMRPWMRSATEWVGSGGEGRRHGEAVDRWSGQRTR